MGRPQKSLISRGNAIEAALEVIDAYGLEAFSVEQVARRLGVRAPSLYYHFTDRAELLSSVAQRILNMVDMHENDGLSWEESCVDICVSTRRLLLLHPNAAPLVLRFLPRRLRFSAYEYWLGKCPYPPEARMIVLEGTEKLTFGSALFAAASHTQGVSPMPPFDPQEYPEIARAVEAAPGDDEELFTQAVRAFLAGCKQRFARDESR